MSVQDFAGHGATSRVAAASVQIIGRELGQLVDDRMPSALCIYEHTFYETGLVSIDKSNNLNGKLMHGVSMKQDLEAACKRNGFAR